MWFLAGAVAGLAAGADVAGLASSERLGLEDQHFPGLRRAGDTWLFICIWKHNWCTESASHTCMLNAESLDLPACSTLHWAKTLRELAI